jgi:hypothetical protein
MQNATMKYGETLADIARSYTVSPATISRLSETMTGAIPDPGPRATE